MSGDIWEQLLSFAEEELNVLPENPFRGAPDVQVLRRTDNRKWIALKMEVEAHRLGLPGEGTRPILNIKCDPNLIGSLRMSPGFLPAYHMNKESWISILLDGTVPPDQIIPLMVISYDLVANKKRKHSIKERAIK